MNKISTAGLNLVSKSVKENINQTKSLQNEVINIQQDVIKNSKDLKGNFIDDVSNALNNVAKAQSEAAEITKNYELGKEQDLTKVIVNQQISKLAFQLTLNVRNKVLSAYKDIMNMPV
jgi:flagellar hook-basal body complex protein FliE